jgi:hypothetical protein
MSSSLQEDASVLLESDADTDQVQRSKETAINGQQSDDEYIGFGEVPVMRGIKKIWTSPHRYRYLGNQNKYIVCVKATQG